jgi:hypothetical protein
MADEIEKPADADWLETPAPEDTGWLDIRDPHEGKITREFQHLIDACMRGTDRVMATDNKYMAFRPFNREKDKETNPRTKERVAQFLADGKWKHIGTFDEVQVYELLEGNAYGHKANYTVGQSYWKDIRTAAKAACDRHWPDYHDILAGMATALKAGRDPGFARTMWGDTLNQVAIAIKQMNGPSEQEINEGFMSVRKARGIAGKSGTIATLDSKGLQKVGFTK